MTRVRVCLRGSKGAARAVALGMGLLVLVPAAGMAQGGASGGFLERYGQALVMSAATGLTAYGAMRVRVERLTQDVVALRDGKADRLEVHHGRELMETHVLGFRDAMEALRRELEEGRKDLHRELEALRQDVRATR